MNIQLVYEAARTIGEDPDRLSFIHAVQILRRRIINPGAFPTDTPRDRSRRD